MHVVTAFVTAKLDNASEVESILRRMIEPTLSEPTCQMYRLHRSLEDRSTFFLYEVYDDRTAFEAHTETPHFANLIDSLQGLLIEEPRLVHYEPVDEY